MRLFKDQQWHVTMTCDID